MLLRRRGFFCPAVRDCTLLDTSVLSSTLQQPQLVFVSKRNFNEIYVPPQVRLRRGDPLEKAYQKKLAEMKEEELKGIVWRLASGVVLERQPLIARVPLDWEQKYQDREFERKVLLGRDEQKNVEIMQDWKLGLKKATRKEKRVQKKEKEQEKVKTQKARKEGKQGQEGGDKKSKDDDDEESESTSEDETEVRRWTLEEVKALVDELSPRITEADKTDNRKSLDRKLDEPLYLIVKKNRDKHAWQFPQGGRNEGETMRQCAERELREECGPALNTYLFGNAPSVMLKYVHTTDFQKSSGFYGSKVFFYRAMYLGGVITLDPTELQDYAWVAQKELVEYFEPELHSMAMELLPPDLRSVTV